MANANTTETTGREPGLRVRWLDDGSIGTATLCDDGTYAVRTVNPVTRGIREDLGARMGINIEVVA
jgi:hypothetical protein